MSTPHPSKRHCPACGMVAAIVCLSLASLATAGCMMAPDNLGAPPVGATPPAKNGFMTIMGRPASQDTAVQQKASR